MLRDAFAKARDYTKELIVNTPAEIFALAAAGGLAVGGYSYSYESAKQGQIPLAFSEIGQTELYVEKIGGGKIPPLTRFYAENNDCQMKIFEAYNIAYNERGGSDWYIAYELEKKIERTMKFHSRDLNDCAQKLPGYAAQALGALSKLIEANKELQPVIKALDKSWEYWRRDYDKTVYYTERECNSDGECRSVTKSRRVYDYSIHHYRYDAKQGAAAAQMMTAFAAKYPDLKISEQLLRVTQTGAENEWAMRESRRRLRGYTAIKDYAALANMPMDGSNYNVLTPVIDENHAGLLNTTPLWDKAKNTSRSYSVKRYSTSDRGSEEYRTAQRALSHAAAVSANIGRMTGGIAHAGATMPALVEKIKKFVDIEQHYGKGDSSGLRAEILKDARENYTRNYAGGFDIYPSNWLMTAFWTLFGLGLGGGIGYALDRHIDIRTQRARAQQYARNVRDRFGRRRPPGNPDFG